MLYQSVLFCCMLVYVTAAPPTDVVPLEKQQPTVIPIVSQSEELEPNGTYKFSYETGNGIKREETSYSKIVPHAQGRSAGSNEGGEDDGSDEIRVQRGSYSYTAPDGTIISVRYIADENGFQPIGDHIPQAISIAASANSAEKSGRALYIKDSADAASAPAVVSRSGPPPAPAPAQEGAENKPESEEVKVAAPEAAPVAGSAENEVTTNADSKVSISEAATTVTATPKLVEASTAGSEPSPDDSLITEAAVSEPASEAASEAATTSAATATEAAVTPEAVSATEEATTPAA